MKAYRDYFFERFGHEHDEMRPDIVLCRNAHPSFVKAAEYLEMNPKLIEMDNNTYCIDTKKLRQIIDPKVTAVIILSAPSYAHGIIDPIEIISEIAYSLNIPVHVDAGLGGTNFIYFYKKIIILLSSKLLNGFFFKNIFVFYNQDF